MRSIAIDIGNTRIKSGEFIDQELIRFDEWRTLEDLEEHLPDFDKIIMSSVRGPEFHAWFLQKYEAFNLTVETDLPIELDYGSKETLGVDRIACAVGA